MNKRLESLEPEFREKVEELLTAITRASGMNWQITSGRRTIKEQNALFAQGRTQPGQKVTNAKGGQSPHNFGLAADCCPCKPGTTTLWWDCPEKYWTMYGELAEGMGLVWGGHFKTILDRPHVEDPNWKQVQAKWKAGEIEVV